MVVLAHAWCTEGPKLLVLQGLSLKASDSIREPDVIKNLTSLYLHLEFLHLAGFLLEDKLVVYACVGAKEAYQSV